MKYNCDGFTLEVAKVKDGWVQKATVQGVSRYRFYHYKKEADRSLLEWFDYQPLGRFMREFNHNFNTAEELGIEPV